MSLHLVRIRPDARALARFAHDQRLPAADPGYLWHLALRQAFSSDAPQPFRVFEPDQTGPAGQNQSLHILGYSAVGDEALADNLARASEPVRSIFPRSGLAARRLPDSFSPAGIFGFSARVCPIVQTRSSDGGRSRELDAFLHATLGIPADEKIDRADVYLRWLAERLASGGARLIDAGLVRFHLAGVTRRRHASPQSRTETADGPPRQLMAGKRKAARRPDAVIDGHLEVTEPDAFMNLLAKGIGRHRAFGYGLLLLRRAA